MKLVVINNKRRGKMAKRQTFRKTILEAKENNEIPMFY